MIQDMIDLLFPNGVGTYVADLQTWLSTNYPDLTGMGIMFIPWDVVLATVVLCVFIICLFKFMRTVLTKIL